MCSLCRPFRLLLPTFRSGTPLDEKCDPSAHKLSASAKRYLLIDTNVALHQVRTLRGRREGAGTRGAAGQASRGQAPGQTPGGAGTRCAHGQIPRGRHPGGRRQGTATRGLVLGAHMGRRQGTATRADSKHQEVDTRGQEHMDRHQGAGTRGSGQASASRQLGGSEH